MTKEEAYIAMQSGKKVRHTNYANDEYAFIRNNRIITEDGVDHGGRLGDFWAKYQIWPDGWMIVQ